MRPDSTEIDVQQSPFHAGERAVQARLGVREVETWARRAIRPFMPDQHRRFFEAQPFLVAAARDPDEAPWATLLVGEPGFVASPDDRTLAIRARPGPGDPLADAFGAGAQVGLVGIDFATRRRNRVNGRIAAGTPEALTFVVDQSFGNCPQHIHRREWRRDAERSPGPAVRGARLSAAQQAWIAEAATFFIASGHAGDVADPGAGMDASHRGGAPGFVEVPDDRRLRFPDYAGNNFFNTLGNLVRDPRIGLLFVDWTTGGLLQLTGRAEIDWAAPAGDDCALRAVTVELAAVVERPAAIPLRWDPV